MGAALKSPLRQAASEEQALEEFHARGWTDGLPVVIPTPARVERMLLAGGLDADLVLGEVGPSYAAASVEKVAVNAVMAGCLPDYFPVVIAAVRAVCEETFDLGVVQSTTHALAPVIIVNGPARAACGIASGWGALGPGHRANASIGRALRLVMTNIGGAQPGVTDMAVLGQPGKFTCCLGGAEESSPYAPLHVSRGLAAEQSAVTVVGVEAPHSVIASPDGDDPDGPERIVRVIAGAIANAGSNSTYGGRGTTLVALNPNHARMVARRYATREALQQRLHELAVTPKSVLAQYSGASGRNVNNPAGDEVVHAIAAPEKVVIVVAGGEGIYSAVFNTWGGGQHHVLPATREIALNEFCELPADRQAAKTKG